MNGSLTTIELRTGRRGTDAKHAGPTLTVVEKFGKDILGAKSPSPTQGPTVQSSSARKISPHNFWLQKPVGIDLVEENSGASSSSSYSDSLARNSRKRVAA